MLNYLPKIFQGIQNIVFHAYICQPAREVTFTSAHHILTNQTKENIFCVTEKHGIVERNRDHVPKFEERMGQKATEFRQMW